MSLNAFFDAMGPFLRGEKELDSVQRSIGPSPSGEAAMNFYATLVRRNHAKILREVFVSVQRAAKRSTKGLWPQLVREYAARTRVMHHDPNEYAREFSDWLAARRAGGAEQSPLLEELADYQWIRHLARHAPRSAELGLDERVFVRRYSYAVPRIATALWREEAVELNTPEPTSVIVYREHEGQALRCFYPTAMGLGVLIEVATGQWPASLEALAGQTEARAKAQRKLSEHGVLPPA